jgi:hypothetical protein
VKQATHSWPQVMELNASSGKKLSTLSGLYGAPEAIAFASGVVYCCCNSGTICCWGSRYLAASHSEHGNESASDCMVWGTDARLNADVLSPSITMRFRITDFVNKQQPVHTEEDPSNLRNNLRRFLGATPKKDASKSRPHPILRIMTGHANDEPQTSPSGPISSPTPQQSALDETLNRRQQIRQVWLGPAGQNLSATRQDTGGDVSARVLSPLDNSRDQFQISVQPSKLLRSSDFDAAFSSIISAGADSSASGPLAHSVIDSVQLNSGVLSSSEETNVNICSSPLASPAATTPKHAGEFFLRAKEYLRTRHIAPSEAAGPALQDQRASTVKSTSEKSIDITAIGAHDTSSLDDSVFTWRYISHAWGSKPKLRDDSKLQPKPN